MAQGKGRGPKRAERVQLYLHPAITSDAAVLAFWKACERLDRPQEIFRRVVKAGLQAMMRNGEIPESLAASVDLAALMPPPSPLITLDARDYGRGQHPPAHVPHPSGVVPSWLEIDGQAVRQEPAPAPRPAPLAAPAPPPPPSAGPMSPADLLALMEGS